MKINVQFKLQHVYFALSPNTDEIELIKEMRPPCLLLSHAYWAKKNLADFIAEIGYRPTILIDCGAYTYSNTGRELGLYDIFDMYGNPEDGRSPQEAAIQLKYDLYALEDMELSLLHEYVEWLDANNDYYDHVVVLDDRFSPQMTLFSYYVMRELGYNLLPVFHYGHDREYLDIYVQEGCHYIALGGSVGVNPTLRAAWAAGITRDYQAIKFHLLGTLDKRRVLDKARGMYSCDGSAWITSASFSRDREEGESKVDKARNNIRRMLSFVESDQLDIYYTLF